MRTYVLIAALFAASGPASPAAAAIGQCYDAFGRPVGPAFPADYPNQALIQSETRLGGTCAVITPPGRPE